MKPRSATPASNAHIHSALKSTLVTTVGQEDKFDGEINTSDAVNTTGMNTDGSMFVPYNPDPSPASNPSAPEIKSEEVRYLDADYLSFAAVIPNEFIHAAETKGNFLAWAEAQFAEEDVKKHPNWIRKPNAVSDAELSKAINGKSLDYENGFGRSFKVGFHAVATLGIGAYRATVNIVPGTMRFSNNAGTPMIHVDAGLHYLVSPRHQWGKEVNANDNLIQEGNITIVRILPGQIGMALENGHPIVLLPGRHAFNNALFKIDAKDIFNVNQKNVITFANTISIVRVFPNELGFAYEGGTPILLLPGVHIKNSASFHFVGRHNTQSFAKVADDSSELSNDQKLATSCEHGNISIVRVNRGQLGLAFDGHDPVLLNSGIYIRNCGTFLFEKSVSASEPHVQNNTVHVIQVNSDQLGLAWDNNKAVILDAKVHQYHSNTFRFDRFVPANEKLIKHGTITIFRVDQGELGYALEKGIVKEFEPGIYRRDDAQFQFVKTVKANEELIQFGSKTHLIVKQGQARAVWKSGELEILDAGLHDFDLPKLIIAEEPIYLQDVVKTYDKINVITKDRMPMFVTSMITYCVSDPAKLVNSIGQKTVSASLEQTVHGAFRHFVSLADLSLISPDPRKKAKAQGEGQVADEKSEADKRIPISGDNKSDQEGEDYRGSLCQNVLKQLKAVAAGWGIEVKEIAINDICFQNKAFEDALAAATADTRKAETNLYLQQANNAVALSAAEATAAQAVIKMKNEQELSRLKTTQENDNLKTKATAQAEGATAAQTVMAKAAQTQAEAKRDADIALATGQEALAKVQLMLVKDPNYVELEKAKLMVQISANLAKMQVPVITLGGEGNSSNPAAMFMGKGMDLVHFGMAQQAVRQTLLDATPDVTPQPGNGDATVSADANGNKEEKDEKQVVEQRIDQAKLSQNANSHFAGGRSASPAPSSSPFVKVDDEHFVVDPKSQTTLRKNR